MEKRDISILYDFSWSEAWYCRCFLKEYPPRLSTLSNFFRSHFVSTASVLWSNLLVRSFLLAPRGHGEASRALSCRLPSPNHSLSLFCLRVRLLRSLL